MVNCPTCGQPVPDKQRFCGNCGTDVQAASAYRAAQTSPGSTIEAPTPNATGFGYGYDPSTFSYTPQPERRFSRTVILLIIAGVALLCLCCGLLIGGAAIFALQPVSPLIGPTQTPAPSGLILTWQSVLIA